VHSAGRAITSDLASVAGSLGRMASDFISNVSRDTADFRFNDEEMTNMRTKLILLSLLLASCNSVPFLTSYKMDIRQGNFVTPDMREKLKIGMTKPQVRYVLGTPMINDIFHNNRWDYAYRLERDGKVIEQQNMTLYFEGENLSRIVDGSQPVETAPAEADGQAKG
jgi:outer membrane protein assembly factor BamE